MSLLDWRKVPELAEEFAKQKSQKHETRQILSSWRRERDSNHESGRPYLFETANKYRDLGSRDQFWCHRRAKNPASEFPSSSGRQGGRSHPRIGLYPQRLRPADNEAGRNLGERHAQSFPLVPCHHSAVCARICGACAAISKPPDPVWSKNWNCKKDGELLIAVVASPGGCVYRKLRLACSGDAIRRGVAVT